MLTAACMWVGVLVTCMMPSLTNFRFLAGTYLFVEVTNGVSADTNTSTPETALASCAKLTAKQHGALTDCHSVQCSTGLTKAVSIVARIVTLAHAPEFTHACFFDQGKASQLIRPC